MLEPLSSGWFGVLVGLTGDTAGEAWSLCARMHLLADPESPDDILPIAARDRRLPRYPLESADQHRARLIDAWEIYKGAGSEEVIETQLRAAGYGPTDLLGEWGNPDVDWGDDTFFWGDLGAFVQFRLFELGPRGEPAPYWSQFWVVFNEGFHPVTGMPTPWGDFTWGDIEPWVWRPEGYSLDFARTIIGIIRKWKPSRWVFRGFRFMVNNVPWGLETLDWGDPSVIWGGSIDVPVPITA
jgi:hypothetical protein